MVFNEKDGPIILVVEDEKFMQNLIKRMLENIGIRNVISVNDGNTAIDQVQDNFAIIDCILLDIEMPDMNGIQFLRRLRAQPKDNRPNIPVIMVTGHSNRKNIEDAIQLGVSHFLTKPVAPKDLEKGISAALRGFVIDPGKV